MPKGPWQARSRSVSAFESRFVDSEHQWTIEYQKFSWGAIAVAAFGNGSDGKTIPRATYAFLRADVRSIRYCQW